MDVKEKHTKEERRWLGWERAYSFNAADAEQERIEGLYQDDPDYQQGQSEGGRAIANEMGTWTHAE